MIDGFFSYIYGVKVKPDNCIKIVNFLKDHASDPVWSFILRKFIYV